MSFKKWISVFAICSILFVGVWAAANILVDPFGIFGDTLLDYSEYSMTQNPRIAKIAYLDKNHEKYDSYVIGCSKTSSFPTDTLNRYFDAEFYNMIMYGGDLYDIEKTVEYILENYGAKNIVVGIGLEEAKEYGGESDSFKGNLHAKLDPSQNTLGFYFKYLFLNPEYAKDKIESYKNRAYLISADEVFVPETGAYNKSRRDAAKIQKLSKYLELNPDFTGNTWNNEIPDSDKCVDALARIKAMCENNGTNLVLIACPVYEKEMRCYNAEQVKEYYKKIAEKVDFWNFSGYTDISFDARYFYDSLHFRNCVGDMMLARIFSDESVWVPENFGIYTTSKNKDEAIEKAFEEKSAPNNAKSLPVLMYHHFTEEDTGTGAVSRARLEEHLVSLIDAGYTPVSLSDIKSYTKKGTPLPEKPILITIDDGYSSALEIAAPVLEKYDASATVAVIGCSIGHTTYKDTDIPITPHFALEEALEYVEKGTLEITSHTWNMHEVEGLDGDNVRLGVLQKEGESEEEYLEYLENDFAKSKEALESAYGTNLDTLAYPHGKHSEISEVFLSQNGIEITFTTNYATNEIVKGIPQTLRLLDRITVDESVTGEKLIQLIEKAG